MTMTMIAAAASQKRSGRPFIIKVNYASGFTVTLPLVNGYNYNFIVDWGDGAVSQVIAYNDVNRIHAYASGGTYTITMTGTLEGWTYAAGMSEYIIGVDQGGRTGFKTLSFRTCTRLTYFHGPTDTSGVTSLRTTFLGCTGLTNDIDVSDWDVSNVVEFGNDSLWKDGMFSGCTNLTTLNLSNWRFNTISNIKLSNVFYGCAKLTTIGDTSGWNTEKFNDIGGLFYGCSKLTSVDVSGWDTSNIWTFTTKGGSGSNGAFEGCSSLTTLDVSGWSVSKVTLFQNLFSNCTNITSLDTSTWSFNTTSNINLSGTFYNCAKLTTIGDTSGWNTTKFNVCSNMFTYCYKLENFDVTGWSMGNVIDTYAMFMACQSLYEDTLFDVSGWDMSNNTRMSYMFAYCNFTTINISGWNISKVTNFGQRGNWRSGMFYGCPNLTSLDLSSWSFNTTSNVDVSFMFSDCPKLTTIGDTSGWNTSKFYYIGAMFRGCSALTSIDLDVSGWNVSNVVEMSWWSTGSDGIFMGCASLTTLDCTNWNTSSCTRFNDLFSGCTSLTTVGDISGWTVTNGTLFNRMFQSCTNLTTIGGSGGNDLTGWNMAKATSVNSMFFGCRALDNLDLSGWSLGLCTNFEVMFFDCPTLSSLNVSGWSLNTTSNISMNRMFESCDAMTAFDLSSWNMTKVTNNSRMFLFCTSLLTLTLPSTLSIVQSEFATGCTSITTYNFYPSIAPTVSGTPFGNYAKPLHVPVSNSGYNVAPWTNTAIFSSIINDL